MSDNNAKTYTIRDACPGDAAGILAIYAPHVLNDAITFEFEIPSVEDMAGRILATQAEFPYFVAEDETGILGYAYAGRVRSRAAYQWSAELSIYVREDVQGRGIGRTLVERIVEALTAMGVKTLYAVITHPNVPSEAFHNRLGFERLYAFEHMGWKLGQWWGVLWMSMTLGEFVDRPSEIVAYPLIKIE
ncbi:hypothetical protein AGMMS49992_18710 [Clostridia bacterium]|nr:hypothetical protein AGMMS49992_18710 [Clostridia bacterium]